MKTKQQTKRFDKDDWSLRKKILATARYHGGRQPFYTASYGGFAHVSDDTKELVDTIIDMMNGDRKP